MSITEYLQIQPYIHIEKQLFTSYESIDMINIYNDIRNINIDKIIKIRKITNILNLLSGIFNVNKRKIICLFLFYLITTPFGYYLMQKNENFRNTIFEKYKNLINIEEQNDLVFVTELKKINI